jgi:hypothetical protein
MSIEAMRAKGDEAEAPTDSADVRIAQNQSGPESVKCPSGQNSCDPENANGGETRVGQGGDEVANDARATPARRAKAKVA